MDDKIETVQAMYEAFGRGDVAAILDRVTDDVDWAAVPDSVVAPWYGARRGKAEVPSFFAAITESTEITEFTPLAFTSDDTNVMVVIRYGITARATGRSAVMLIHHWFRFRGDLIDLVRTSEDSALVASLLTP